PGFLQNPEVRRWLNGVEPVWTMLDFGGYTVLRQEPLPGNEAIQLRPDLTESDLAVSAVLRTARTLLQRAGDDGGLKLTATGTLSRSVVAEMIQLIEWPNFNKITIFNLNKVINEPDFLPFHFPRLLLQATKLVQKTRNSLVPTRLSKKM